MVDDSTPTPLAGPLGQCWLSPQALQVAFARVLANDGAPGVDHVTVQAFAANLEAHCAQLHGELAAASYQPQPLRRVWLPKKNGGQRGLAIPAVRDRVVQCALALGLMPAMEREFEPQSYAYRPGLGVHDAVAAVERARDAGCEWILDADIDGFFDQVSHELLIVRLAEHVPEVGLLQLVLDMLICAIDDDGHLFCPMRGLPQGSPLSPLLANLFLDPLDEALAARWRHVRYADDFIVLLKSQDEADEALSLIRAVLGELELDLHSGKTGVRSFAEGFEYLGARFLGKASWFEWNEGQAAKTTRPLPAAAPTPPPATTRTSPKSRRPETKTKVQAPAAADPDPDDEPAPEAGSTAGATSRAVPWLRTLYVVENGAYLAKDGERVLVKRGQDTLLEVPVAGLDIVLMLANGVLSTPFLRFAAERGLLVAVCDPIGRVHSLWPAFESSHVQLQAGQFAAAADPQRVLPLARQFVLGKLRNARVVLKRLQRHRGLHAMEDGARQIGRLLEQVEHAPRLEVLRGLEGAAAAAYFGAWRRCLPEWGFDRRERRGRDRLNQMLNLAYGVLRANVLRCAASRGLHPGVGFLHALRDGHPALVSDLMEEFRPLAADAVVMQLALSGKIDPRPAPLDDAERRTLLRALERKLNAPLAVPGADERLDLRRAIDAQVRQLARHLSAPADAVPPPYRPFAAR